MLLLVQMVLLPVLLWLMLGPKRVATLPLSHIAGVSVAIIAFALLLALLWWVPRRLMPARDGPPAWER